MKGHKNAFYEGEDNGMWCITCRFIRKNIFVGLQLCSLPANIASLTIKYKIGCNETGKEYHGYADVNYLKSYVVISNDVLLLRECTAGDYIMCSG